MRGSPLLGAWVKHWFAQVKRNSIISFELCARKSHEDTGSRVVVRLYTHRVHEVMCHVNTLQTIQLLSDHLFIYIC